MQTRWSTTQLAVKILGGIAAFAILGDVLIVSLTDNSAPVGLVAIASGCTGALATLVAGAVADHSAKAVVEALKVEAPLEGPGGTVVAADPGTGNGSVPSSVAEDPRGADEKI